MTSSVQISCDAAVARATTFSVTPARPALALTAVMAASSLAYVDAAITAIGLPAIGRAFDIQGNELQWVLNAYLLPVTALSLLGGAWGDRFGRRYGLILGATLFAIATLGASLAPTIGFLIGMRLLEGAGAALLIPNSLAILGQMFSGEAEARAVGLWSVTAAIASAFGPILAGLLIDSGHWRSIFLVNLPVAVFAVALAAAYVPHDAKISARRLDLAGGASVTAALCALIWSLRTVTLSPANHLEGVLAWMAVVLALLSFVWVESRLGDRAMVPLSLFSSRTLSGVTLFTLLLYGAFNTFLTLIPFVLLKAAGYSGAAAGAIFVPLQISFIVVSPLMGRVVSRTGAKLPLALGALMSAVGFLLAIRLGARTDYWRGIFPAVLLLSIGMSVAATPLTTLVLTSVDRAHTATASGINSTATRLGGLITTALLGSVLVKQGDQLFAAFSPVMMAGAAVCILAAFSVLIIERTSQVNDGKRGPT
jgi:EmrB/QacA subfamily drug resistance transporter